MKNKMTMLYAGLAVLLLITGVVVYKAAFSSKPQPAKQSDEEVSDTLPQADASIVVKLVKSAAKANTVVLSASGLGGKIVSVGYELSYDSQGLIKGVQSGSKPIETAGQDTFEREVYLGTCSKNDCKPDAGVTKVSIVLEFTDTNGKKSQYSKDYDL